MKNASTETVDFLYTKEPTCGYETFKAVSERAKQIQAGRYSFNYVGWFVQDNFRITNPEYAYEYVDNSILPKLEKSEQ